MENKEFLEQNEVQEMENKERNNKKLFIGLSAAVVVGVLATAIGLTIDHNNKVAEQARIESIAWSEYYSESESRSQWVESLRGVAAGYSESVAESERVESERVESERVESERVEAERQVQIATAQQTQQVIQNTQGVVVTQGGQTTQPQYTAPAQNTQPQYTAPAQNTQQNTQNKGMTVQSGGFTVTNPSAFIIPDWVSDQMVAEGLGKKNANGFYVAFNDRKWDNRAKEILGIK